MLSSPAPAAAERPAPVTHRTATVRVTIASTQRSSDTARVCLPRWDMGNGSYRWDCSGTCTKRHVRSDVREATYAEATLHTRPRAGRGD
ncbi:hypothetical protein GCM10023323_19270 [Streptomyces thinghirensis]|uniref:Secreted protein n=1 Tax=Streptomyces thinghirensis TaxID=551547 RepID=A0ABP9T1R9_9ACTN